MFLSLLKLEITTELYDAEVLIRFFYLAFTVPIMGKGLPQIHPSIPIIIIRIRFSEVKIYFHDKTVSITLRIHPRECHNTFARYRARYSEFRRVTGDRGGIKETLFRRQRDKRLT